MGDICPLAALAAAATRSESDAPAPQPATSLPQPFPQLTGGGIPGHLPPQARASVMETGEDPLLSACWGAQLRGDVSMCTPGFTGGTAHFKVPPPHPCDCLLIYFLLIPLRGGALSPPRARRLLAYFASARLSRAAE